MPRRKRDRDVEENLDDVRRRGKGDPGVQARDVMRAKARLGEISPRDALRGGGSRWSAGWGDTRFGQMSKMFSGMSRSGGGGGEGSCCCTGSTLIILLLLLAVIF